MMVVVENIEKIKLELRNIISVYRMDKISYKKPPRFSERLLCFDFSRQITYPSGEIILIVMMIAV